MRAQKFMAQISVTVFDIDEIESQLVGHRSRSVKGHDDAADLSIGKQGII